MCIDMSASVLPDGFEINRPKNNPNASDAADISPQDLPAHLQRRFHIRLNHMDCAGTVIIE